MSRYRRTVTACLLLAALGLSGTEFAGTANAQSLGSVEGFMRRTFGPPQHERRKPRENRRRIGEKPKGEARPKAVAKVDTGRSPPAATVAPVPVPNPNPRPEPKTEAAKADAAPKDGGGVPATAPAPVPVPLPEPEKPSASSAPVATETDRPTPVPGQPNAVQPPPIEAQPPEDIPVPEKRPPEAPSESASPPPATEPAGPPPAPKKPPIEGQAGAEPPKSGDAPNSTVKLKSREPTIDPATSVVAAAAIEDAEQCEAELKKRGVVFEVKESISEGECGVLRPVSFERSSSGVKVSPGTQMLCRAALALDTWLSDSVVPAAKANFPDRKLTEFRQASTYVCRPRASENGISEHARGSAIDIGAFVFDKGEDIGVAAQGAGSPEAKFQDTVRAGACGPFKTVLGPGTDPDHATHFHLDIAARRNGATYCK